MQQGQHSPPGQVHTASIQAAVETALESRVFSSSIFIFSNLEPKEARARVLKDLSQENGVHRPIGNV